MAKKVQEDTVDCPNCGGTGSLEDHYLEVTQGVYLGECGWCNGTGQVEADLVEDYF